MVATAKRKAERAKAFAEAQAKSHAQTQKNASKTKVKQNNKPSSKPEPQPSIEEASTHDPESKPEPEPDRHSPAAKTHRFILFIGNLPFTATTPQIEQHFASIHPISIRHSTDKITGKSKGFAFLEFDDYSRMTACIKNFHHSVFGAVNRPDGGDGEGHHKKSKGEEGRRINVELTVGGGGSKSTARKMKLRAKNEKLSRERRKKGGMSKSESNNEGLGKEEENMIHPSRRAKVAG